VIDDAAATDRAAAPPEGELPAEVHRAEGALSARLGISIREGADALRTIAQYAGRPLSDVARHVLADRRTAD
jgi:hypothetical protein